MRTNSSRNGGNGHADSGVAEGAAEDWFDEVADIIEVMRPLQLSGGVLMFAEARAKEKEKRDSDDRPVTLT